MSIALVVDNQKWHMKWVTCQIWRISYRSSWKTPYSAICRLDHCSPLHYCTIDTIAWRLSCLICKAKKVNWLVKIHEYSIMQISKKIKGNKWLRSSTTACKRSVITFIVRFPISIAKNDIHVCSAPIINGNKATTLASWSRQSIIFHKSNDICMDTMVIIVVVKSATSTLRAFSCQLLWRKWSRLYAFSKRKYGRTSLKIRSLADLFMMCLDFDGFISCKIASLLLLLIFFLNGVMVANSVLWLFSLCPVCFHTKKIKFHFPYRCTLHIH